METVLMGAITFLGSSIAGGITWDMLKAGGKWILNGFQERFVKAGHFQDKDEAEQFIRDISSKELLHKRHPMEDVWAVYDNCTGKEAGALFQAEFQDWLNSSREDFKRLGEEKGGQSGISIQKQVNKGHAQVTNIGNQYRYTERGR